MTRLQGGVHVYCLLGGILVAAATLSAADAHGARTSITLDSLPEWVYEGQQVAFTGVLSSGGWALQGATVQICEDDPFVPDTCLGSGTTDEWGQYYIVWTAKPDAVEVDLDIYAKFDKAGEYKSSQTKRQTMSVYEYSSGTSSAARDDSGTSLDLYYVPSVVYVDDYVFFEGMLTDSDGYPLPDRTVRICEDDPLWPDKCLVSGTTDEWGWFFVTWLAEGATFERDFDIYAKFEGDSWYRSSQTSTQTMTVSKVGGSLTLDPVPDRAAYGEMVVFSGTLSLDAGSPENAVVYIKDEDRAGFDDLLASAYVDGAGHFETYWIVEKVDFDSTIDIQAVFEGDDYRYERLPTPIQSMRAYNSTVPIPDPSPVGGDGYMELKYALDFDRPPRVAIMYSLESQEKVRKHIVPVQEGIQQFAGLVERQYPAGDWSVEFDVVEPGGRFDGRPDIMVDIVTRDEDSGCGYKYDGLAWMTGRKPIQTLVCSLDGHTNSYVSFVAAHEFVHAIGVGHTFNIPGDMMCSRENGVDTCTPLSPKSQTPSFLNLAAVAAVYGTDGFQNPNNLIVDGERFALGGR